jgi:hypothetical protein
VLKGQYIWEARQGIKTSFICRSCYYTVPDLILFVQMNVTVVLLVQYIRELCLTLPRHHFPEEHNGLLNVFAVQNQVDCNNGVYSVKAVDDHTSSYQDLHSNLQDFASLPVLTYRTCLKVYHACTTMLCRIAASQLPKNLCKIDMQPDIWRMIKHHLQHKFVQLCTNDNNNKSHSVC